MMPTAGRCTFALAAMGAALFGSPATGAGTDTIAYPESYRRAFVEYRVIDAPAVKRVRIFYVAPEVLRAAAPRPPLPDGTVLVMEVRDAKLDAGGQPMRDVAGRFVAGDRVVGLWVQAKTGGAWTFARFDADGTRVAGAPLDRCIGGHATRAAQDFTYLLWKYVATVKGPMDRSGRGPRQP